MSVIRVRADVVAEFVRSRRLLTGLTQEELADRAQVSPRTVRNVEAAAVLPRPDTLRRLAAALGATDLEVSRALAAAISPEPSPGEPTAQEATATQLLSGDLTPRADTTPAQLPADVWGFVGRREELQMLDDTLESMASGSERGAAVVVVSGAAGVGKTALAVHWAHRVSDRFPDGQLYVNLRGFDYAVRAIPIIEVMRRILEPLGVAAEQMPAGIEAQIGFYRSVVASRRLLILLDNVSDVDQVRLLLPGSHKCFVLVTSRNLLVPLVAAVGARHLTVEVPSTDDARQLLVRRIGAERVAAAPGAVEQIIKACGSLPLALAVVGARASIHPSFSLDTFAEELRWSRNGLDGYAELGEDADLRAVFSWSYNALRPEAARVFRLVGLHPAADASLPAIASLTGLPIDQAGRTVAELVNASMLSEHQHGRFRCHDLLRMYAVEQAVAFDNQVERDDATRRVLDHYLHSAHAADRLLSAQAPGRIVLDAPAPGVTVESYDSDDDAVAWLKAERPVVLAVIGYTADHKLDDYTWRLARVLRTFFDRQGSWREWAAIQEQALEATMRLNDPVNQAHAHHDLARAYNRLARYEDARTHLQHALGLFEQLDDRTGQARAHTGLAYIDIGDGRLDPYRGGRQAQPQRALDHAMRALELFEETGDRAGQARALANVGWCHARLGNYQESMAYCTRALVVQQEIGDPLGEAGSWHSIGYAYRWLGDPTRAIDCYGRALDLSRGASDNNLQVTVLADLAEALTLVGDATAARDAWKVALDILEELDHPDADDARWASTRTETQTPET